MFTYTKFSVALMLMLFATPAFAQSVQQVLPGCTFAWEEPMVDDPANPGQKIGAWALAGDLDGFKWVTNDVEAWDKTKLYMIDKADRTVPCSTVGVEDLGTYVVMIRSVDTSANASGYTAMTFKIVQADATAPAGVIQLCANWKMGEKPMQLCTQMPVGPTN
ncbi:MAG: hypothetical protein V3W44_10070 [Dehalococcoidales bacterium]